MAEPQMPRTYKVTKGAAERARASLDPSLKAPSSAKEFTDKNNVTYKRWVETGNIEAAYREASKDATQVVYILGVKFRPGEPNQNKMAWLRMRVHPDIAEEREVSTEIEEKYGWLTERALGCLVSLIDVTGFTPKSGDGLSGALLEMLFPLKPQKGKSPLVDKSVAVKMVQRPNTPPYDASRPFQEDPEQFLPAAPISGVPAAMQ